MRGPAWDPWFAATARPLVVHRSRKDVELCVMIHMERTVLETRDMIYDFPVAVHKLVALMLAGILSPTAMMLIHRPINDYRGHTYLIEAVEQAVM